MKTEHFASFVIGLLSGTIVGAAVVILLAPQSGTETRRLFTDRVNEIINAGKRAVTEKRQELRTQYETSIQIPLSLAEPSDD
jgi:gas vesicle protein